ncbi:MAG: molybdenum cofactor biosynthesis protein MoaE [Deltaproteobacteria bacterium]|nr:molybdenum cofactor biosynthesis protein MoaE [Deltaproteobacteria bacterium]
MTFSITPLSINLAQVLAQVETPAAGALATFCGVVRDNSQGRQVKYLIYEAYPAMALKELERIKQDIRQRWPIQKLAITHRIGRLEIGEASVMIAVSSHHRGEALAACQYAINRLKVTVPIWKKEFWEGGEVWVEGCGHSEILPPA